MGYNSLLQALLKHGSDFLEVSSLSASSGRIQFSSVSYRDFHFCISDFLYHYEQISVSCSLMEEIIISVASDPADKVWWLDWFCQWIGLLQQSLLYLAKVGNRELE